MNQQARNGAAFAAAAAVSLALAAAATPGRAQNPPLPRLTSKTKVSAIKVTLTNRYLYGAKALRTAAESQNVDALRRNLGAMYSASFTGSLPGVKGRISRDRWLESVIRGGGLPGAMTGASAQDALTVAPFTDYEATVDRVTTRAGGTRATAIATQSLKTEAVGGATMSRLVTAISRDEWQKGRDGIWRLTRSDVVRRYTE